MKPTILAVAITTFISGCTAIAANNPATSPATSHDTTKGMVLATPAGITLYTFDMDKKGVSHCTNACAQTWPPFSAKADAQATGEFSVIKRADGSKQWSYEGKPLYTFVGDTAAGDANGNGIGGVWHIVPAAGMEKASKTDTGYSGYGGSSRW